MIFDKYKGFTKPYIVQHVTNTGTMEDPHNYGEVVGEFDLKEEAEIFADMLFKKNNTEEEIKSAWCNNNYYVNINTSSKEGKRLHNEFKKNFDKMKFSLETKIGKQTFHHNSFDHQDISFEIIN